MRIGKETGSLVNHLYSRGVIGQPEPEIGMGATMLLWSDRHAGTVVSWDGKVLGVQRDNPEIVSGHGNDGSAKYEYKPNPSGPVYYFRREPDGRWMHVRKNPETGRWNKSGGYGLKIGVRDEHYDPSF